MKTNRFISTVILMLMGIMAWSYPHLSPYSNRACNPAKYTDPSGEDIVILNFAQGQHLAMLIQNEGGRWEYYSINGDNLRISTWHFGGREFNDIAIGDWGSPQEFLDSSYNSRPTDSKDDKSVNNFGYDEGYQIETTPVQDAIMQNEFIKASKTEYNLFFNNCATTVQKVMVEAGIPVSEPSYEPKTVPITTQFGLIEVFNGYRMKCGITPIPTSAFNSIMKWNPNGKYLRKRQTK